jgi:hypothetical protein
MNIVKSRVEKRAPQNEFLPRTLVFHETALILRRAAVISLTQNTFCAPQLEKSLSGAADFDEWKRASRQRALVAETCFFDDVFFISNFRLVRAYERRFVAWHLCLALSLRVETRAQ